MQAAIDVGSNTVRMLIGEVHNGKVVPHLYQRSITRLKGGQNDKGLAPEAMDRTLFALRQFMKIASRNKVVALRAVGTEALRSAPNSSVFINTVQRDLSLDIEVISGESEAGLSSSGVLSVLSPQPENAIVLDIGGGSTEIVIIKGGVIIFSISLPLGVVRLAEMGIPEQMNTYIREQITLLTGQFTRRGIMDLVQNDRTLLVGTAGTITTLAALDMEMTQYDWRRVNNYPIQIDRLHQILGMLRPLSPAAREAMKGMEPGRGDLIVPGLSILESLMIVMAKTDLVVSDFGLLEGVLLQMATDSAMH